MLLSFTGISFLLGLTWLFGVFTFISSNVVVYYIIQVLFTIFNASQGFFIFIFFVVINSDSREAWISLVCQEKDKSKSTKTDSKASKEPGTMDESVRYSKELTYSEDKQKNELEFRIQEHHKNAES